MLTVNLGALAHNWQTFHKLAPAAAVVKADAYGLGMAQVASTLHKNGCRLFYAAYVEGGITLRSILPAAKIIVLNGFDQQTQSLFIDHNLIPILNTMQQVQLAVSSHISEYWLQVGTGMHRCGLVPELWQAARDILPQVDCLLSHLACADMLDHSQNQYQLKQFQQAKALFQPLFCSLAASYGAFLGKGFHFDHIRPGIGLYHNMHKSLKPVVTWHAKVLEVRDLKQGDGAGYGASWQADQSCTLATVNVGYADGYPRILSNKGIHVVIDDQVCPVVGRVSMDSILAVVPKTTQIDDDVTLIGKGVDLSYFAAKSDTIEYEILTGLGNRVKRVYKE